jgi:hypothetical protein
VTRVIPTIVTAVALLIGVALALAARDARVHAEARTVAVRDSLTRIVVTERARVASADSAAVWERATLDSLRAQADLVRIVYVEREREAVQLVAAVAATLDATLDALEHAAPDELRPVVAGVRVQLQDERDARDALADALRGQALQFSAMVALADSATRVVEGQRDALRGYANSLEDALDHEHRERKRREGFVSQVQRGLPWLAAGVVAGLVLR